MSEDERHDLVKRAIARHFHKKAVPAHPGYPPPGAYYPPRATRARVPNMPRPPPGYYGAPPPGWGATCIGSRMTRKLRNELQPLLWRQVIQDIHLQAIRLQGTLRANPRVATWIASVRSQYPPQYPPSSYPPSYPPSGYAPGGREGPPEDPYRDPRDPYRDPYRPPAGGPPGAYAAYADPRYEPPRWAFLRLLAGRHRYQPY